MARKVRRGQVHLRLLGFLKCLSRRGRKSIWFKLDLKRWAESNGLCYNTALHALQDLAAAAGDFQAPPGRKGLIRVLPANTITGARKFKFRMIQVKGRTNARFIWHVAPVARLEWDQEPLLYRRDRQTSRHVRRQLRTVDLETECSEASRQYATSEPSLIEEEVQQYTTPAEPGCSESAGENHSAARAETRRIPGSSLRGENAMRRKAYALLGKVQEIHAYSTGRVQFSRVHAVGFLFSGLKLGYADETILNCYRRAHDIATASIVDGMVRKSPLAYLLGIAKRLLRDHDSMTATDRIAYRCASLAERRAEEERFHAQLATGGTRDLRIGTEMKAKHKADE